MIKLTTQTPNGLSVIGAATLPQLEQTAKKDFIDMLHADMYTESIQKNYVELINGHRILFRPLDDEGKAKSLNLCYVWVEEGSEVSYEYIAQLETRLRNKATKDHRFILTTNPDMNHVRSEILLKSDVIYGDNAERYVVPEEDRDPTKSSHLASTRLNKYLPDGYYERISRGKPRWWVLRNLEASFEYTDGAVWSNFADHIVEPFDIPESWERIYGADFGRRDPTVLLEGAIDPETGTVYICDEYYETGRAVPQNAEAMLVMLGRAKPGRMRALVADPSGKNKSIHDNRSLFSHYAEYGVYFTPGDNRIETGISKVHSYFTLDRLKIFKTCTNTVREGINYRYKAPKLATDKNLDEKPIDKDNHTCDCLRYMVSTLPDDPERLKMSGYLASYKSPATDKHLPYELRDTGNDPYGSDWYNNY